MGIVVHKLKASLVLAYRKPKTVYLSSNKGHVDVLFLYLLKLTFVILD
jgi:hypothetical protein